MKLVGYGPIRHFGIVLSAVTLLILAGCGTTVATISAPSLTATPAPSSTPNVAAARTAALTIIVPLPGTAVVWGGCTQLAGNFAACPFAPVLVARLNSLSSSGYFGDAPPAGVCGEDYITGTQNGLFAAPQILSATGETNGTVTVVIERGSPPPNLTVTMTFESGAWLATDLASGTGPSASIFSAKPDC